MRRAGSLGKPNVKEGKSGTCRQSRSPPLASPPPNQQAQLPEKTRPVRFAHLKVFPYSQSCAAVPEVSSIAFRHLTEKDIPHP